MKIYPFLFLILVGIFLSSPIQGQIGDAIKRAWIRGGIPLFVSGYAQGTHEILVHKYHKFQAVHSGADPDYWDPDRSYGNKWEDGKIENGPAFFGSSTFLAWTTDGKHLLSTIRTVSTIAAVVWVSIGPGPARRWWTYLVDAVIYTTAYQLGFHLSYSLIYKGHKP